MAQPVKVVFGGNRIGNREPFTPSTDLAAAFQILQAHGVDTIDSAQGYNNSQATLGEVHAGNQFALDTKWGPPRKPGAGPGAGGPPGPPGGGGPWATKEHIVNSAQDSVQKMGVKQLDIFYIHRPDPHTPIAETLAGVQQVYEQGAFKRFGLSNYNAADVEAIYNHCKEHNYVLPSVYQGTYSPITRFQETQLFPTLRRLGLSFYAFSPSAGGFLGKTVAQIEASLKEPNGGPRGRRYAENPVFLGALKQWNEVAAKEGVSPAELAYRYIAYHSALKKDLGDALIIGAGSLQQLEETLTAIEKGPLSEAGVAGANAVWDSIKDDPSAASRR
ncbi:hypothetical protein SEUCBS139899_002581 [Sporothrix eucalyptigena]|uniref:NADP-dependent oxidoreductase domain-containing protein n=1 Tax=Sporothrix eucalyptigena TaxID=1812306 RepID=A0ABP0BKT6_9PEZI